MTGASRGIGAHLAAGFAAAGYRVAGCSRTGSSPDPTASVGTIAAVDVTDQAGVERFVAEVMADHGRIDVLINAAGVIEAEVPLWQADPQQWWQVMEVNVRGPFLCCYAVVPHLLAAGGGRVINLNSGAGFASRADLTAYCASKSALARITGGLHLAGYELGLRAFDLAPGHVATDMTASMRLHEGRTTWTPPQLVVELALALASGELDAFSGRMVRVGVDTPASLRERAAAGLAETDRTLGLVPWGPGDPLA